MRSLNNLARKSFNDGLSRCNHLGLRLIDKIQGGVFLDAGCGDGALTLRFADKCQADEIHGIEAVDTIRGLAEKKGIKCKKADLNGAFPYPADYFNIILSSQTIEHLHNTRSYLEECYRCLKPGGQLIVLTENLSSWVNIVSLLFGWQPFSTTSINGLKIGNPLIHHMDDFVDEDFIKDNRSTGVSGIVGHVRVLAFNGLKDILGKTGFKRIKVLTRGYLPFYGGISDFLCSIDKVHGHFLVVSAFKD